MTVARVATSGTRQTWRGFGVQRPTSWAVLGLTRAQRRECMAPPREHSTYGLDSRGRVDPGAELVGAEGLAEGLTAGRGPWRVAEHFIGSVPVRVSTIFWGVDTDPYLRRARLWETMIEDMPGLTEPLIMRWPSRVRALSGHRRAVRSVRRRFDGPAPLPAAVRRGRRR